MGRAPCPVDQQGPWREHGRRGGYGLYPRHPACRLRYYAANEAEKVARIKIIHVDGIGKYGRVHIAGEEAEVLESKNAVERCLAAIDGRAM